MADCPTIRSTLLPHKKPTDMNYSNLAPHLCVLHGNMGSVLHPDYVLSVGAETALNIQADQLCPDRANL